MKEKMTKITLIALGISLVAATLVFLTVRAVPARADDDNERRRGRELEPQVASDTVSIQASSFFSDTCGRPGQGFFAFDRSVVKFGGTVEPFTIPAGKVLVVTSFDWSAEGSPAVANQARTAFLFRVVGAGGINGPSAQSTAIADSNGRAGGSETFPTGMVLQNPGQLCLAMGVPTPVPGEVLTGVLQGFLAPDK
jgi:hypothetical protein